MPITPELTKRLIKDRSYPQTVRALAEKWGPLLDVDPSWIVAHCFVESSNKPLVYNPAGKAWGLMQLKLPTATDMVARIKSLAAEEPKVKAVLVKNWRGQGEDLLNPELNLMLGTFYLGLIRDKFKEKFDRGDHEIVAAAYNQGPGAVRKALKSGKFQPTSEMQHYIAKIAEAKAGGYA